MTIHSRKSLINAYTFKHQKNSQHRKHDPVSLYAKISQSWNSSSFLRNKADAKEGRKLELDKRNKISKIL